jgi:5'-nucleotidase
MHILITNDDGVQAPGILALAQALREIAQVTVFAPNRSWSTAGHSKTLHRPLRAHEVTLEDGATAFTTDGSPSDCVGLAVLGMVKEPIDLVVSGINNVSNMGDDLTYSGTITAAMEGVVSGIPSIAVSLDGPQKPIDVNDFRTAANIARQVVQQVAIRGLPPGILLSVNVPFLPAEQIKGFRITHLGKRDYHDVLVSREDPRGHPYYWIGGSAPTSIHEEGSDVTAVRDGYVSITPLHLDLTAYHLMDNLNQWNWND